jgi:TP901 family phage tail tape measure protein
MESKTKILEAQLQANAQKQEALTQKLEAAKSIYGENSAEAEAWATKLTRAKTEQQNLETQLQQCTQEIKEQTDAEQKAQTPLEQLNSTITEQKLKLEQLKTQYKNVALESGDESTEAQELKTKINQLNTELGENEAKLKEVDAALDETGSSAEAAGNGGWTVLKGVVSDLASDAIQQGIEAVKDFAKDTVQLGVDFSSSMSNVQALSGATSDQLAELEKTARDLGASTIFSASDVADAFGYMALAGWDTSQMLSGIDGVLNLAAAADMNLATASDIVTDNLTAFGLSAQDSGAFVDQMAYAMANSNTNVEQLGEAYQNCASTAHSMGFSVEDTTAALMTMANAGVKGGEAGTGLSSIMTRLATDTKGCAGELEKYGVEVYDSHGNMNDLSSILNGCAEVWSDLSDEEQANLAKTIAGQNQFSKFQTVMQGLSEQAAESGQSFNDYTAELENVKTASEEGKSAAEDMANTMQDNLGGDIKTLNSALEELKLKIFLLVMEQLKLFLQF